MSRDSPPQAEAIRESPAQTLETTDKPVVGYPRLGNEMGLIPEIAIFRRFGSLNAQMLLYLQAEIIDLENQLRDIERKNKTSKVGKRSEFSVCWYWLSHADDEEGSRQWDLMVQIKEKLKEYNSLLIQQRKITAMHEPNAYDLEDLQHFLASTEMGPQALTGDDSDVWGSFLEPHHHSPDLVALQSRHREDPFSRWVTEKGMKKWFSSNLHRFRKPDQVRGAVFYQDGSLLRLTYGISSVIASLLPITSIVVLYLVKSIPARLGLVAVFNFLLSVCLTYFTTAKRAEIFAVTAAFAAVQVVFIGSNNL